MRGCVTQQSRQLLHREGSRLGGGRGQGRRKPTRCALTLDGGYRGGYSPYQLVLIQHASRVQFDSGKSTFPTLAVFSGWRGSAR
jgi:hypothetical protein